MRYIWRTQLRRTPSFSHFILMPVQIDSRLWFFCDGTLSFSRIVTSSVLTISTCADNYCSILKSVDESPVSNLRQEIRTACDARRIICWQICSDDVIFGLPPEHWMQTAVTVEAWLCDRPMTLSKCMRDESTGDLMDSAFILTSRYRYRQQCGSAFG